MEGQGRRFTHGVPDMGSAAELRAAQEQFSPKPPDDYTPPPIPRRVTLTTGYRYRPTSWAEFPDGRVEFRFDRENGGPARGRIETNAANVLEIKWEGDE